MKNKRQQILMVALLGTSALWTQFSALSPIQGWVGRAGQALKLKVLRSTWRNPCESAGWQYVDLEGSSIPIPDCFDSIRFEPSIADSREILIATDSSAPDVWISASALETEEERIPQILSLIDKRNCEVYWPNEPVAWSCRPFTANLLMGRQFISIELSFPAYVSEADRDILRHQFHALLGESIRHLQHSGSPANNRRKPTAGGAMIANTLRRGKPAAA